MKIFFLSLSSLPPIFLFFLLFLPPLFVFYRFFLLGFNNAIDDYPRIYESTNLSMQGSVDLRIYRSIYESQNLQIAVFLLL